jgi:ankyrin repeat protein
LLLERGADPTQHEINWIGGSPLHWASEREPEICQMLIDAGAEVNARIDRPGSSHLGGTPLHWCARQPEDCGKAIEVLLKNGGDPTIIDGFGKTALDYAEERGHSRVAAALRSF